MKGPATKEFVKVCKDLFFIFSLFLLLPASAHTATLKLAVLPWNVHAGKDMAFLREALPDMLTTRLGSQEGMSVARADRVKGALAAVKAGRDIDVPIARGVGRKLDLDYVLFGSITVIGKAVSLDASLLHIEDGKVTPFASSGPSPDSIVALVDSLSGELVHHFYPERALPPKGPTRPTSPPPAPPAAPLPGGAAMGLPTTSVAKSPGGIIVRPSATKERSRGNAGFWKSGLIKGEFVSLAAADLDGNGTKEFLLLEKDALTVAVREGNDLRVVQKIRPGSGLEFVSLTTIDTDGDGKVEVYVSALEHLTAASAVLEYHGGKYSLRRANIPWLLRKGHDDKGRALLLGQRFRASDGFYGGVKVLANKGGQLALSSDYLDTLPRDVNLYNFTYFDFNQKEPGRNYLLAFDKEGHILVYTREGRGWSVYWKSKEQYGGTMHRIVFNDDTSGMDTYRYIDLERPLFHMDTDGDGRDELIVRQSQAGGVFKRYAKVFKTFSGGSIVSLTWDGEFLTEAWRTREINGYIADFFIDDLGGGARKLVMIVHRDSGLLSRGNKSYLLIYGLEITPPPSPPNPQIR